MAEDDEDIFHDFLFYFLTIVVIFFEFPMRKFGISSMKNCW